MIEIGTASATAEWVKYVYEEQTYFGRFRH